MSSDTTAAGGSSLDEETAEEETPPDTESVVAPTTEDEERTPVSVDHRPPRASQLITMLAVIMGVMLTVPYAILAIPFGVSGVALVAMGTFYTYSRSWLTAGTALILLGTIVTGAYGAVPPELMLLGVGAVIIGWDAGQHGIVIGNQLGRETHSRRNLLVHTTISALVVGLISTIVFLAFLLASGGQQAPAVAVVIIGITILTWVYRN